MPSGLVLESTLSPVMEARVNLLAEKHFADTSAD